MKWHPVSYGFLLWAFIAAGSGAVVLARGGPRWLALGSVLLTVYFVICTIKTREEQ